MNRSPASINRLLPLGEDTIGPYYPYSFLDGDRCDLTRVHPGLSVRPNGDPITLRISLHDSGGAFVPDALVEFWQANAAGVFRSPRSESSPALDPYFEGHGRLMTSDRPFEIRTIRPGSIPADNGYAARAPHITVTLFSDGVTRLVTQVFFDDAADANAVDPLLCSLPAELRTRLVARRDSASKDEAVYALTIVLRGKGETPFFDDLSS